MQNFRSGDSLQIYITYQDEELRNVTTANECLKSLNFAQTQSSSKSDVANKFSVKESIDAKHDIYVGSTSYQSQIYGKVGSQENTYQITL